MSEQVYSETDAAPNPSPSGVLPMVPNEKALNLEQKFKAFVERWQVEGIWQGLKVFEQSDIDTTKFRITNLQ
ncbi:MAG: hypothetical protein HY231_01615 [Acidobacteria bacterium]|nr:hypothetical protein [Acidobacteriota bacterium]